MIWKERYNIGVPRIDDQHKELFKRVTQFVETVRSAEPWETKTDRINETLRFMKDYVVTHFADEEEFQQQIGYPDFEEHCKIHRDMVAYVTEVSQRYEQQEHQEVLMQQFAGKLLAWLINHVADCDNRIADYVRSKGDSIDE